jgi:hypothetical protein
MIKEDMEAVRDLLGEWVETHEGSSMKTILEKDSVALSESLIGSIVRAAELAIALSKIRPPMLS